MEACRDRGGSILRRGGPVVLGMAGERYIQRPQLGARDPVAALPLSRRLVRVGTPRVRLLVEPTRHCYAQRPCRCRRCGCCGEPRQLRRRGWRHDKIERPSRHCYVRRPIPGPPRDLPGRAVGFLWHGPETHLLLLLWLHGLLHLLPGVDSHYPKVPREGRMVEGSRHRGCCLLRRADPVVLGSSAGILFRQSQLVARNPMVVLPPRRCLVRVGAPRDLPLAKPTTHCYTQRL
ncbi:Uncharacterised protein [Mycobacteroides abscessus subsp. abscessus]|nr:Uncharacterised protein [Mycobacteroides abscessus subsp. abscessus]